MGLKLYNQKTLCKDFTFSTRSKGCSARESSPKLPLRLDENLIYHQSESKPFDVSSTHICDEGRKVSLAPSLTAIMRLPILRKSYAVRFLFATTYKKAHTIERGSSRRVEMGK